MKHTEKKGYSTKGVNKLCDPNVYKFVSKKEGQTIRQLFRHVCADKIYRIGDEKNKMNHGVILNEMKKVDDRRYLVTETSNKHKGNFEYFEKLYSSFNREFYEGRPLIYVLRDDAKQYFDMEGGKNEEMERLVND